MITTYNFLQLPLPEGAPFRPAVCELSGHILLHDNTAYDTLTNQDVWDILALAALDKDTFSEICESVKRLLEWRKLFLYFLNLFCFYACPFYLLFHNRLNLFHLYSRGQDVKLICLTRPLSKVAIQHVLVIF